MSKSRKKQKAQSPAGKQTETSTRELNGKRGSPVWRFNYFRSVVLTSLLNDLYNLEQTGIEDKHCKKIAASLNYFSNAATDISSAGPFMGPLYKDIEKFTELYLAWNDIKGEDSEMVVSRRELRHKLMAQRQRITNKARQLQFAIQENVDTQLMKSGFDALGELITAVPDLLSNLGKALEEFAKRGGIA